MSGIFRPREIGRRLFVIKPIAGMLAAIAFAGAACGQSATPLTPEIIFQLEAASAPSISPDGERVAYVRRTNDVKSDQTRSSIWLVRADGSHHEPLSADGAASGSPRWSPDGQTLAYTYAGEAGVSLRTRSRDGSDSLVTELPGAPGGLAWSPDGNRLAWSMFKALPGPVAAALPAAAEDAERAAPAVVENRLTFRLDGAGNIPPGIQQFYMIDLRTGTTTLLSEDGLGGSGDFVWANDGASLIFSADRRPQLGQLPPDSELHRLDIATGDVTQLTDRAGPDASPRASPDGQWIAYLGYDDHRMGYHNTELYIVPSGGGTARSLTASLDRSVGNPQWAGDSSGLYVQFDDRGTTRVGFVALDGSLSVVAEGLIGSTFGRPYTGGDYAVSATGDVVFTTGSPQHPAELALVTADGVQSLLTDLNSDALAGTALSPAEAVSWASPADGRDIHGWVLYPPDFDPSRAWPMILEIHGGPFTAYGPTFSAELQLMAAAGYVVLYTNPRGSTSYGYDFANLIHHAYPGDDYDDLMGGVDHMLGRGFIDEERLFVTGGSGGGLLTAWIIGNTDRFAAAASVKPVINWASFVLYSDLPQFFYRYWFASPPWEDPDEYWRRSPLSLVGNVTTPTLMMVGGADVRTPRAETEQYYSALHLNNVPTRLVIIPDSFHGISNSRPSRLLTKVAEILRWFDEHDPGAAPLPQPGAP
ncbi:peptidase S9, prolyl oligopeptidase active site domain protein [Maricaulis maris MCS10]|uniref:Peptidase S9, prolyl oligopeptidase active site domain protein n=1 Tax=Maricaulis maris (strain MCS10) TaxID=394221 RepID=Q0AQN0_MARMM|nr:peptidase S9, prolyl oligopeptidase active site domain protein [Maricaulis maris MCS10]